MFELSNWHFRKLTLAKLVKRYQESDSSAYPIILKFCNPLIDYFVNIIWYDNYFKKNTHISIKTLYEKGLKGLEHAVKTFNMNGDSFLAFAAFHIYCGMTVIDWKFSANNDNYIISETKYETLDRLNEVINKAFLLCSYQSLYDTLQDILPSNALDKIHEEKIKDVDFSTKYSIPKELIKKAKNGNKQALMILSKEHYGDIIESIISKYRYLARDEMELIEMKADAYRGLEIAFTKLPSMELITNYEERYYSSYILAHIVFYSYFSSIVTRVHPNMNFEKLLNNRRSDIKDIFNFLWKIEMSVTMFDKKAIEEQDLLNWYNVLDYLEKRFTIVKDETTQLSRVIQLQSYRS